MEPGRGTGEVIQDQIEGNVSEAAATYPALRGVKLEAADASRPESTTVDRVPIIDRIPGVENAIFATGWSGHGWAIAPAVSTLLSEWVTKDMRPRLLEPFSLTRFHGLGLG